MLSLKVVRGRVSHERNPTLTYTILPWCPGVWYTTATIPTQQQAHDPRKEAVVAERAERPFIKARDPPDPLDPISQPAPE